jgi:hypothetical protein
MIAKISLSPGTSKKQQLPMFDAMPQRIRVILQPST